MPRLSPPCHARCWSLRLPVGTVVAANGVPWLGDLKLMSQTQPTTLISQERPSNKIYEKCRDAPTVTSHPPWPSGTNEAGTSERIGNHHPWHPHLHICLLRIRATTWRFWLIMLIAHTPSTLSVWLFHENRHWQHRCAGRFPQLGGPSGHGAGCHSRVPPRV